MGILQRLKDAVKGTNFWFAVLLFLGTFVGLTEGLAQQIMGTVMAMIATVGAVRIWIKNDFAFKGKENLNKDANMWNYLGQIFIILVPMGGDVIPALAEVVDALVTKQYNLVISRGLTLLTVIFFLLRNRPTPPVAPLNISLQP